MKKIVAVIVFAFGLGFSAPGGALYFDKAEYAGRRARLMAQIPDGIAVIWGALATIPTANYFRYALSILIGGSSVSGPYAPR